MRDRHVRRRLTPLLVAAALAATLVGCVGIPTAGPVTVGQSLAEQDSGTFEFFPLGPVAGADQEAILAGFVSAFTGSADDFKVAREFLSTGFSDEWNPRSSVTVRTSAQRYAAVDDATMEYTVSSAATVDSSGTYRQNNEPVPLTLRFSFVQEDGEWRISAAPDGIVLADATFRSIFNKHALYFLDPTADHLVPDLRWFAGGTAALRAVSALLTGPPPWLQGAVRTAFPDGTKLETPNVEVQDGVALVDLTTDALAASPSERQLMQAQLTATLANVSNIRRVSISVGGAPLAIPDLAGEGPEADPGVDPRPVVLRDDEFGYLARGEVTSLGQLSAKVVATLPRGATLSSGAGSAAVLGAAGVSIVPASDAEPTLLDPRQGLITPALDDYDYVWSAAEDTPTSIRVISFGGDGVDISTGLSADARIVSVDISRDGTRIAILADTPSGPRLVVKAILRDANAAQVPTGLGETALDATSSIGTAVDATWVDELSVAVLSGTDGQRSVSLYEVGGDRAPFGQPVGATSIVGGNGEAGLRALGADGSLLARSGSGWTDTGVPVSFIATQR